MPKTGTTALQRNWFSKWEQVNYCGPYGCDKGWEILRFINSCEKHEFVKRKHEFQDFFLGKFNNDKQSLISKEEILIGHQYPVIFNFSNREEVIERFLSILEPFGIIIVVRNQMQFVPSLFAQWQKHWYIKKITFSRWLALQITNESNFAGSMLNIACYRSVLEIVEQHIPKDNIKVMLYEDFISSPYFFMKTLAKTMDIDCNVNEYVITKQVNQTRSKTGTAIFNIAASKPSLRSVIPSHLKKGIKYLANVKSGARYIPNDEEASYLKRRYKDSNSWLKDNYGLDLMKYNYPI